MRQTNYKEIHKKTAIAFLLMIVFTIPVGTFLFIVGRHTINAREREHELQEEQEFIDIVTWQDRAALEMERRYDEHLSADVQLMTTFLKKYVTKDGYSGPRVFEDGFVVEFKGDKAVLPEEAPEGDIQIDRELVEESLASGSMRTESFLPYEIEPEAVGKSGLDIDRIGYYLSFGKIADNFIYVKMSEKKKFLEYLDLLPGGNLSDTSILAEIFDGITLIVEDDNGSLNLLGKYGEGSDSTDLTSLGITPGMVSQETIPNIKYNDQDYHCVCVKTDFRYKGREDVYLIQLLPVRSVGGIVLLQTVSTCLLMLLIFVTFTVYAVSEQRLVMEGGVTEQNTLRYNPRRLRFRLIHAGISATAGVLLISLLSQALGQMYQESWHARDVMDVLSNQLEASSQLQSLKMQEMEEEIYVHHSELIASVLDSDPEQATQENLLKCQNILEVDYLMLFDSEGKEIAASNDYTGFSLDIGSGENFADFHRLLMGIPSIVHSMTSGDVTGCEQQVFGVSMKALDNPEKNGALLMALIPDQAAVTDALKEIEQDLKLLRTGSALCFKADVSTGIISAASDVSFEGKSVQEFGLTEKSLQDNYLDFGKINETDYFIVTEKNDDDIFYYADPCEGVFKSNLLFASFTAVLFAVVLCGLSGHLLKGYDNPFYEKWASLSDDITDGRQAGSIDGAFPILEKKAEISRRDKESLEERQNFLLQSLEEYTKWKSKMPEEKAGMIFGIGMGIMLAELQVFFRISERYVYGHYGSLFGYLIRGDWIKGLNFFSVCAVILVVSIIHLFSMISRWFLQMISEFLSIKGATICKLMRSLIRYGSVAAILVMSLYYIGVLNSTVIASLGLGSLALSFGAKDLVADILAGIFIVFEGTLSVGDYVEYGDVSGKVVEIGSRYTRLEVPINNILSIRNQEIHTILNKSMKSSYCVVTVSVLESEALPRVEEILKRELPAIRAKCSKIKGTLDYLGVDELGSRGEWDGAVSLKALAIGAACAQNDYGSVKRYLNREICLLFEKEGIRYF